MSMEPYFIWDGMDENEEPESRDDIAIILAHGVSETRSFSRDNEKGECNVICMSQIHGGWTKAFETLFENQEDPEFVDRICLEIEHNLIREVKELVEELMAILEFFGLIDRISDIAPLELGVRYLWTSENRIRVQIKNEFLDKVDELEDIPDKEAFEEMKKWLEVSTNLYFMHRSRRCRRKWENFINLNFEDPEQFRQLFTEMLERDDLDEDEIAELEITEEI